MPVKRILIVCAIAMFVTTLHAQRPYMFKDSLDGRFDVSDWVISYHGFIPVPTLITEPAFGNIGGALGLVFISRNPPYIDTVNGEIKIHRVKPNIYGAFGAYTANGTWLAGGGAIGTIRKWRANYRIGAAYANVNLRFYKTFTHVGEKSFEFNIRTLPVYGELTKRIGHGNWYAGINYLFIQIDIRNPNPIFEEAFHANRKISIPGVTADFDNRDNVFTPDKGLRWNTQVGCSDHAVGSDYDYWKASTAAYGYIPLLSTLILGLRAEYQQAWNDIPFYMQPYLNARGFPTMRYQGNITTLTEAELRWDFTHRWSAVGFCGTGKAINDWSEFKDNDFHTSAGGGFRYLLARKLKLRMGVDIARGPEQWAYYLVFGNTWLR